MPSPSRVEPSKMSSPHLSSCMNLKTEVDMRRLTTGIRSEKCVVRRFRRCANVYLHKPKQYSIAYYTPRLHGIACCSEATNLYSMLLY